jgi:hypothetical protein
MKATVKKDSAKMPEKKTEVESEVGSKYFWNDSEIDEGTHKKLTEDHRLWVIAEEEKSAALQVARLAAEKKNSEDIKLARKNRKAEKLARK